MRRAEEKSIPLKELDLAGFQAIHPAFGEDVYAAMDFQRSVEARDAEGGTAPSAVRTQIERAIEALGDL